MRRLIIANTYYQILFAIQLRKSFFASDDVTLIISDHSNGTQNIVKQLEKIKLFSEVILVESLAFLQKKRIEPPINHLIDYCFKNKTDSSALYLSRISNKFFDELLAFNIERYTLNIFSTLSTYNPGLTVSHFEEGILSYNSSLHTAVTFKRQMMDFIRKIQRKAEFTKANRDFYCFYPELYEGELKPVKVPLISDTPETIEIIKSIFDIKDIENSYHEKYIFFTSGLDFEGEHPIGEYEVVCKVADLVGKENLLIKTHPRDKRTIYIDNGFKVDKNSNIPWEAIQLSGDFSDKVFLTATSSAVLAGSFMSSNPPKTFFLYKLCNIKGNTIAEEVEKGIIDLLNNDLMKSIFSSIKAISEIDDIVQQN